MLRGSSPVRAVCTSSAANKRQNFNVASSYISMGSETKRSWATRARCGQDMRGSSHAIHANLRGQCHGGRKARQWKSVAASKEN
eukprot:8752202-Pyramimonas_sp.AAC.1